MREFTTLLSEGDRVLVRFRDFGYFAEAMGPGSGALLSLVHRHLEWDGDDEREDEQRAQTANEPWNRELRLDLSVEVSAAISRWMRDPVFRADLTEVALANGEVFIAGEDNRIISSSTRRAAEDEILRAPRDYREWLAGTRLAPNRIRSRRLRERFRGRRSRAVALGEPLNSLATKDYLDNDEIDGDEWLSERTTVPPEERDW